MSINCFPGYEHIPGPENKGRGRNMYRGMDMGFGGLVYFVPGIWTNVALLDAESMHPSSIGELNKLGEYTPRYLDLRQARVYIKHHDYESCAKLFNGKLVKYLTSEEEADALSGALKLPINAFFGTSFASYENPARDSRDFNDIIALRGALFMKTLMDEVEARGFKVVHIKTDSLKIPNATPEIIKFVQEFGKEYGYNMEHEATYDRMCLVNGSTYIAKYDEYGIRNKGGKKANQWVAVATQFQVPYVFKTLFSHEDLVFKDYCWTFESKQGSIFLDMNESLPDVTAEEKQLDKIKTQFSKGKISDTTFETEATSLREKIATGHNYIFVGSVGQFVPIKEGAGGGELYWRSKDGKYTAVQNTSGYRWLESEVVQNMDRQGDIDIGYFERLADEAKAAIEKYGSFERFVSDEPYEPIPDFMNIPEGLEDDEMPFETEPLPFQ